MILKYFSHSIYCLSVFLFMIILNIEISDRKSTRLNSKALASAPSCHPSWWVSRQASWAGECWPALILCVEISPLCPLHPCYCALLRGSEASPTPLSPPVKGLPSVWKLFLLHSSLPKVQVPSLLFCLCFFFFLLPYPGT